MAASARNAGSAGAPDSAGPPPRRQGVTVLVATHDPALMELADRTIELRDGHLHHDDPDHPA
ncbi:hypothetical protein ACWGB8_36890 [Kitasatospora sp. NPDC054939]